MSRRDDAVSLEDMRSHAAEAIAMLGESSMEDLQENRMMQLALTRLVEIVGEAANRVSEGTQEKMDRIPWRDIIGMRNRLIHGYDVIDVKVLYNTVKHDIPPLLALLNE